MKAITQLFFVIAGPLFFATNSNAADFPVGRAAIQFQEENWRGIPLADTGVAYGGDKSGAILSETKMFIKTSTQGKVEAIVIIRGSSGGVAGGTMSYDTKCEAGADWFSKGNSGFGQRFSECFAVSPTYPAKGALETMGSDFVKALGAETGNLPDTFQLIFSRFANSNGTFLQISMFLAPGFVGRIGSVEGELPKGIEPKFVLLGEDLALVVRASVMSLAGRAKMPAAAFDNK